MVATNSAILRASSLSFLARTPLALANWRSLNGLICRTDMLAGEQGTEDAALVATTRLNANGRDAQATQALDQFGPAYRVVADPETLAMGQQHHLQTVARHVDSTMKKVRHLRVPSLLMRARALATVRVWKKRLEHQAHSRSEHRENDGLLNSDT